MALMTLSVERLRERLSCEIQESEEGAVVFDADGTLWSHDVGCMVYDYAVKNALFRSEVFEALSDAARSQGIDIDGLKTANEVAGRLLQAWYGGQSGERFTAEMQVWAYAGTFEDDFRTIINDALTAGRHRATLHRELLELADWVRKMGARAYIVSASPQWVVQEAAAEFGFGPHDIAAGIPRHRTVEGRLMIDVGMAEPLPYGPDKVTAGRRLIGSRPWLATFGDSAFDIDMMRCARLAAGIGDKKSMLSELVKMDHAIRLTLSG